jgi:quinol monooxygenase YgiN
MQAFTGIVRMKKFLVVEEWATQKDWDDHQQSDLFTVLMGAESL